MAGLTAFWQARSPRERRIVTAGAAALLAAALWAYVWVPLQADRARLARDLPGLRAEAAMVAAGAAEAARLRSAPRSAPGGALAAIEARGREAFAGAFGAVAAVGDERYRVTLQPVAFETLARFLGGLAADHGLVVDRLALSPQPAGALVAVDALVLRAPAAP
jgi:general secretion pathway protein M